MIDGWTHHREIEAIWCADIAVAHFAEVQRQAEMNLGIAGLSAPVIALLDFGLYEARRSPIAQHPVDYFNGSGPVHALSHGNRGFGASIESRYTTTLRPF